jgi:hypothetical protein
MEEEDGIHVDIHGTRHQQTTLKQAIIRDHNDYKLEKLQEKYIESKEINYLTTRHQVLRPKIIDFGCIDHQQWIE